MPTSAPPGGNDEAMNHESNDGRANGSGGGRGNGGSGRSAARGLRETEKLCEGIRDHFTSFLDALYFTRGTAGVRGADTRRELADRLEQSMSMVPHVIGLLRVEAVDMERKAREDAEREATEKAEADAAAKDENQPK